MPFRSTAMQRSQSSGSMSSTFAVGPAMPALFTSTSRPPRWRFTSSKRRSPPARLATSARLQLIFLTLAKASSSTSQICTRAPCSRKVCAITRPIPAAPAVTSTRFPFADKSMLGELQLPVFARQIIAEAAVRFLSDQLEPALPVDVARRREIRLRPQRELPVALRAREGDAFVDQALADAPAARLRLDQKQAQLCGRCGLLDDERRADALAGPFGGPAALQLGIEVSYELGHDLGHQRLEALVPAVLLGVQRAVTVHHPAEIAGTVRTQRYFSS